MSGMQALVRLMLDQRRLDRSRGLDTAAFVSGYEGSPLGGLDLELGRARGCLDEEGVVFAPGAQRGAGRHRGGRHPAARPTCPATDHDGVVGLLVRQEPRPRPRRRRHPPRQLLRHRAAGRCGGPDRRRPELQVVHPAQLVGVDGPQPAAAAARSRLGGRGRAARACTPSPCRATPACGPACRSWPTWPTGRRWSTWRAGGRDPRPRPDAGGPRAVAGRPGALEAEEDLFAVRLPRAMAYARRRRSTPSSIDPPRARLGVVAAGHAYGTVLRALEDLGLDADACAHIGLRLIRISPALAARRRRAAPADRRARRGAGDRGQGAVPRVPDQGGPLRPARAAPGRRQARPGGPTRSSRPTGAVDGDTVTRVLAARLGPDRLRRRRPGAGRGRDRAAAPGRSTSTPPPARTAAFCSGCPHNISTRADDDQLVGLGIGCHIMAGARRPEGRGHQVGMTQMGGEGAQWIGLAPFAARAALRAEPRGRHLLPLRLAGRAGRRGRRRQHHLQAPLQRRRGHDRAASSPRASWPCPS